jgi:hypothetical protein
MKTVTMRIDESVYEMIRQAADGQKRNMSNFVDPFKLSFEFFYVVSKKWVYPKLWISNVCNFSKNFSLKAELQPQ